MAAGAPAPPVAAVTHPDEHEVADESQSLRDLLNLKPPAEEEVAEVVKPASRTSTKFPDTPPPQPGGDAGTQPRPRRPGRGRLRQCRGARARARPPDRGQRRVRGGSHR